MIWLYCMSKWDDNPLLYSLGELWYWPELVSVKIETFWPWHPQEHDLSYHLYCETQEMTLQETGAKLMYTALVRPLHYLSYPLLLSPFPSPHLPSPPLSASTLPSPPLLGSPPIYPSYSLFTSPLPFSSLTFPSLRSSSREVNNLFHFCISSKLEEELKHFAVWSVFWSGVGPIQSASTYCFWADQFKLGWSTTS